MAPLFSLLASSRPSSSSHSLPLPSTSTCTIHAQIPILSFPRTRPPPPILCLFPTPNAVPPSVMEKTDVDFGEEGEEAAVEEVGSGAMAFDSPWEGAVVYRRDASVTHVEYSTTLERLGMEKISTDLSRTRAAEMGIRLMPMRGAIDPSLVGGTPVLVSIDVTRKKKKKKLKLDGIVRTVITLLCNRCGQPATECVFSNFTLLLMEEKQPMEEAEEIDMGVLYGDDRFKASGDEEESGIDLDDRLYFPAEENEVDISKHIRDLVHVEITINAVCDPGCKGLCLKCGTNLNKRRCSCNEHKDQAAAECGPLKDLKKKMQQG